MNFFDMNFSELFFEKHGKTVFNNIVKQIKEENHGIGDSKYIELVFKVAFLEFFKMENQGIKELITDAMEEKDIDIIRTKNTHKNSIK